MRGFTIFLACLALGVAAIAAAGSTAEAFRQGLAGQARRDPRRRPFRHPEVARVHARGEGGAGAGGARLLRRERRGHGPGAQRGAADGGAAGRRRRLSAGGRGGARGATSLAQALAPTGDASGAAVEQDLLDKLHLKLGDRFLVGNTPLVARAVLLSEPDRLSRGFALGPRVLTTAAVVEQGRLPGSWAPLRRHRQDRPAARRLPETRQAGGARRASCVRGEELADAGPHPGGARPLAHDRRAGILPCLHRPVVAGGGRAGHARRRLRLHRDERPAPSPCSRRWARKAGWPATPT